MYFHATRLILSNQITYGLENRTKGQGTQQFVELHAFLALIYIFSVTRPVRLSYCEACQPFPYQLSLE